MTKKKKHKKISQRNVLLVVVGIILSLFMLMKFRSFFVFLVIGIVAGIINYFIHVTDFHVHLGHIPFLAVIFSYALGFKYGIFMIVVAHILPEVLAGHADMEMIISALVYVLICFLAVTFNTTEIVALGLTLTVIQTGLAFFLEKISGTPMHELITENGVEFIMMVIYFISFANPILSIIK